jgi:hypothetical protein
MIILLAVLQDRKLAMRALKSNYGVGELHFLKFFLVLHLNQASTCAGSAMLALLYYRNDLGAELALGAWVYALEGVVLEFALLCKFLAAALAGNTPVLAVNKLMRAKNHLLICLVIGTSIVFALESDLIHELPSEAAHRAQH